VATFTATSDVLPPELISAIITSRGIYRPEMIARYLGDGEAPLDVIPLSPG
jgi:methylthioribose-1-phosphate isomerase